MNIYDFEVSQRDGSVAKLSQFKGKVLLIVNTATSCGLTPQYKGLEELYVKYGDKGLVILDFPCNQFAEQAKGSNQEIHEFCTGRFGITFPQFGKIDVNGANASPLYNYLKSKKGGILGKNIKWNFAKFLVNSSGEVVARYSPLTKPAKLDTAIAKLLK